MGYTYAYKVIWLRVPDKMDSGEIISNEAATEYTS